jgi:hypothetical protein
MEATYRTRIPHVIMRYHRKDLMEKLFGPFVIKRKHTAIEQYRTAL